MSFIRALDLRSEAKHRTHWAPAGAPRVHGCRLTGCGRLVNVYPYVCYAEYDPQYVTCRVCLWQMGLYVPLVKLAEHQHKQRVSAMILGPPTNAWAAHGMHSESP